MPADRPRPAKPAAAVPADTRSSATDPAAAPGDPPVPAKIGSYEVVRVLGRGGMGVVYECREPALNRTVAVKQMLPGYAGQPLHKARFVREARAQAKVEHDHIIPIYRVGDSGGAPYIVMPLLKGGTLADYLRHGRPPVGEAVRIGREMAEGLAAAHAAGLVHRDVKPANVALDGPRRRVKLLDFGLAKPVAPEGGELVTHSGGVVGTPAYMSPEQARAQPVDHRTDLFALGVVLYELLTGGRPFLAPDLMSLMSALALDTPAEPQAVNPAVPAELGRLVMRLLEKKPADRPADAEAVAAALRAVEVRLSGVQVVQVDRNAFAELGSGERPTVAVPVRGRPWGLVLAGLALVVAVGVLAGVVLRVSTPKGTLVIESDDPDVAVTVTKGGATIKDATRDREIELAVGDYGIELTEAKDGLKLTAERFEIVKGGKAVVRVRVERLKPLPYKTADVSPPTGSPDRAAAVALLKHVSFLDARLGSGQSVRLHPGADLPDEPFTVVGVRFQGGKQPEGIAELLLRQLRPLTEVQSIALNCPLDEKQLERLTTMPFAAKLRELDVSEFALTDRCLPMLAAMPAIESIRFSGNDVTPALAVRLITRPGLKFVHFNGLKAAPFNDTQLEQIAQCDLEQLSLWFGHRRVEAGLYRAASKMRKLTLLDLFWYARTTDADLETLSVSKTLAELRFWGPVSDAGVRSLARIKSLRLIHMRDVIATPAAVTELAEALPWCQIEWNSSVIRPKVAGPPQVVTAPVAGPPSATTASPFDRLRREDIPAAKLKAAGSPPPEVVAILGASQPTWGYKVHVAPAPDGKRLAVGYRIQGGQRVTLFDPAAGTETTLVAGSEPSDLRFTPDGSAVAVAVPSGVSGLWDVATGKLRRPLASARGGHCLALDPAGDWLAFGSDRGGGDALTVQPLRREERANALPDVRIVSRLAASPDGRLLAVGGWEGGGKSGSVGLWDVPTRQFVRTLSDKHQKVCGLAFSRDGRQLFVARDDAQVFIHDTTTGAAKEPFAGHPGTKLNSVSVGPDGTVASCDWAGTVVLWDAETRQVKRRLALNPPFSRPLGKLDQPGGVLAVHWLPDGRHLATCNADGTVYIVRLTEQAVGSPFDQLRREAIPKAAGELPPEAVALLGDWYPPAAPPHPIAAVPPAGGPVALASSAGTDRKLVLWDVAAGTAKPFPGPKPVHGHGALRYSPDGRRLFAGGDDAAVWDVDSGKLVRKISSRANRKPHVAITPDGHWLLYATHKPDPDPPTLYRLDDPTAPPVPLAGWDKDWVCSTLTVSPDGKTAAVGRNNGRTGSWVRLWKVPTGEALAPVSDGHRGAQTLHFALGGRVLLQQREFTVPVVAHDTAGGKPLPPFAGHKADVFGLAVSPDGKKVATGDANGVVLVWDAETRAVEQTITFPPADVPPKVGRAITQLSWVPDGRHLIARTGDGVLAVLRLTEPTVAAVPPAAEPPPKPANARTDRPAVETLRTHWDVTVRTDSGDVATVKPGEPLPAGKLVLLGLFDSHRGGSPYPEGYASNVLIPAVRQCPDLTTVDSYTAFNSLTEEEALTLFGGSARKLGDVSGVYLPLTSAVIEGIRRYKGTTEPPVLTTLSVAAEAADDVLLARLATLKGVEGMWLYGVGTELRLNGKGLEAVGKMPLTFLALNNSKGLTAADLRKAAAGPRLKWFNLSGAELSEPALAGLADTAAPDLALSGSDLTDAGVPHLLKLTRLKKLDVSDTKLTADGAKRLAAGLPGCEVYWGGKVVKGGG